MIKKIIYPFLLIHFLIYKKSSVYIKRQIKEDIEEMNRRCNKNKGLFYYLAYEKYYRNLFYFRTRNCSWTRFLRRIIKEGACFTITPNVESIGGGAFVLNHPYGTIINAKKIGNNFTICQLTTIGNARHGRNDLVPIIGSNVSIGSNVNIIGNISIGDNVIIGAGSVVVKDVPNDCVVAGNPAKILHYIKI